MTKMVFSADGRQVPATALSATGLTLSPTLSVKPGAIKPAEPVKANTIQPKVVAPAATKVNNGGFTQTVADAVAGIAGKAKDGSTATNGPENPEKVQTVKLRGLGTETQTETATDEPCETNTEELPAGARNQDKVTLWLRIIAVVLALAALTVNIIRLKRGK